MVDNARRDEDRPGKSVWEINPEAFRNALYAWWREKGRSYPWRYENDPYRVLVAELFLQRTKPEQVARVYRKFLQAFPSPESLAVADPEDILSITASLGLRWRQMNLIRIAGILRDNGGIVSASPDELRRLPGIGEYMASAVAVFSRNIPLPLLDAGMVRILGRLFCLRVTDGSRRSKLFRDRMEYLLDRKDPRSFYYALIDLGGMVCLPRRPACEICPVRDFCCHYGKVRSGN